MMDYHLHPSYSADAEGSLQEFCDAALEKGLREICFTTHLDTDPVRNDSYVLVRGERVDVHESSWFEDYENRIRTLAEEYSARGLAVRLGVEVDLYPGVIEEMPEAFHNTDFDLVIGSVHLIEHKALSLRDEAFSIFKKHGLVGVGNIYYGLIEDSLETRFFDILGHIDIYRRYGEGFFGSGIHSLWESHIDDLSRKMKSTGVGYEVNTSSLWRSQSETMPERALVAALRERGVQTVIVGSDAHHPSEVGNGIEEAFQILRDLGYSEVALFDKRRSTPLAFDICT
ncbi:MAG: histidinol-phosphatase HisJ family protein [Candidatus Thorarchaeota archaeon]